MIRTVLTNNAAPDEGLFDLVDVDITVNGPGNISSGTLTQRVGNSGGIEQFLFFEQLDPTDSGVALRIFLESDDPLGNDPNSVLGLDATNVSARFDLNGEFGQFVGSQNFSIVDTIAVPEPGSAFVVLVSLSCLSLVRRKI